PRAGARREVDRRVEARALPVADAGHRRELEPREQRRVARRARVAAGLGQDERDRLRLQLDAGRDHVALALARRIPDDGTAASLDRRDALLDAEPTGAPPAPGHGADHAAIGVAQTTLVALRQPVEQVDLEVHATAWRQRTERGSLERERDQRDGEAVTLQLGHGQAHAVDGDRALGGERFERPRRRLDPDPPALGLGLDPHDLAERVDVALHQVTLAGVARTQRELDV